MQMRVPCPLEFYVDGSKEKVVGTVQNLSGGGLLFRTAHHLSQGNLLKVVINPSAGRQQSLETRARVLRCDPMDSGDQYAVACAFTEED